MDFPIRKTEWYGKLIGYVVGSSAPAGLSGAGAQLGRGKGRGKATTAGLCLSSSTYLRIGSILGVLGSGEDWLVWVHQRPRWIEFATAQPRDSPVVSD
ncbi:hypothetical protein HAX54_031317 [Datura stramonium]|uniref:Uncharacterized protein n=1 Tax=Datura stramonium TaxID=4076 RepID=A0ABS8VAE0_DATST|nr:hypothetical protein [Datura stramonium]